MTDIAGHLHNGHLYAIAAMAFVTLLLRLGGYWLIGRVPLTTRLRQGLEALPVAIFAASVVPLAIKGGPAGWIAAPMVAAVMFLSGKEILALAAGIAAASLAHGMGL
jgi:uncharacterized membrane protein